MESGDLRLEGVAVGFEGLKSGLDVRGLSVDVDDVILFNEGAVVFRRHAN